MLLHFYNGTMEQKTLCEIFGIPPSTQSRVMINAENALAASIPQLHEARIVWPTPAQQEEWSAIITAREPLIENKWGFIDGKNFRVQEPTDTDMQNAMYNGWLHSVFVTGCLCYGVDGTLVWGSHNYPGSWNDSVTSFKFQTKIIG